MAKLFFTTAVLFIISFTNPKALAYTKVTSVTNAYGVNIVNPTVTTTTPGSTTTQQNTTSVTAYGGIAGPDCTSSGQGAPCNSCPSAVTTGCNDSSGANQSPLCACNLNRIYNTLPITINVTRSVNPGNGYLHISGTSTVSGSTTTYQDLVTPTSTNSITFNWQAVCAQLSTGSGTCEGLFNQSVTLNLWSDNSTQASGQMGTFVSGTDDLIPITFKIIAPETSEDVYGDTYSEGIGQVVPFPGDGRIYLNSLNSPTSFPALADGANITGIEVMISNQNLANATIPSATLSPVISVSGSTPSQTYVDGVTNGTGYFVRLAMVDQAGNILQYFPNLAENSATGCDGSGDPTQCPYYVRPDQVEGLLKNDFNCFIANAAYGTALEPKINLLREFRNKVLLRTAWGQHFVFRYYKYGPYVARFIADKPFFRMVTRGLLWPVVGFTYGWLHYGLPYTLAVTLLLLTLLVTLPWFAFRSLRARG